MRSGTALPKIRVEGSLVSYKLLKDQKMLRQGSTPRCVQQEQILPDFMDTTQYFSQGGVFVQQAMLFRPGAFCVDGQLGTKHGQEEEEQQHREQAGHTVVVVCGERKESMGECEKDNPNCYQRCCLPW